MAFRLAKSLFVILLVVVISSHLVAYNIVYSRGGTSLTQNYQLFFSFKTFKSRSDKKVECDTNTNKGKVVFSRFLFVNSPQHYFCRFRVVTRGTKGI